MGKKKTNNYNSQLPKVAVVTPIYERKEFFPILIRQFEQQDYKGPMTLIILDDSPQPYDNPVINKPNIIYIHEETKQLLPYKRNKLNQLALDHGADIIVCIDSDDVIMQNRVSHAVKKLQISKKDIAGSTLLYIYDTTQQKTFQVGPFNNNHGTAGTFAYTRKYLKNHKFDEEDTRGYAEEKYFTNGFSEPMVQLDPWSTIICINHGNNTFDKTKILKNEKQVNIKKIIKDKFVRDFFISQKHKHNQNLPDITNVSFID
jgi:glycosyltransferase involved in cell wall biosynthesis